MRIRQNTGRPRILGVLLGGLMAILKLKKEKMHMASKGDVFGVLLLILGQMIFGIKLYQVYHLN
mgnify:CR=1 FL=1